MTLSKTPDGRGQRRRSPNRVVKLVTVDTRRLQPGQAMLHLSLDRAICHEDLLLVVKIQAD